MSMSREALISLPNLLSPTPIDAGAARLLEAMGLAAVAIAPSVLALTPAKKSVEPKA